MTNERQSAMMKMIQGVSPSQPDNMMARNDDSAWGVDNRGLLEKIIDWVKEHSGPLPVMGGQKPNNTWPGERGWDDRRKENG